MGYLLIDKKMKGTFTIYEFGDCVLDTAQRAVTKNSEPIPIPSKTFDVLYLLVSNYGEIVTKDDILNKIWDGSFVEEGNLTVHISKLRKLLGSTKDQPIIKTVTGKGYQFVAAVKQLEKPVNNDLISPDIHVSQPPIKMLDSDSIAVLPLKNENGDEEIDYLADGLTESLINSLSYMPDVRVIARDTVFRYKNKEIDPREIGDAMDVGTILTGRLRVINGNLAIGVELVKTEDGTQIWGTQLNQPFTEIFEVQESLTTSISKSLISEVHNFVTESLPKEYTEDPNSYRLYLKARHLLQNKTYDNIQLAIDYFKDSITKDPSNVMPYIGLGECYHWLQTFEYISYDKAVPLINEFIEKAAEINSEVAELYVLKGNTARNLAWDFVRSEKMFKHALKLNPNHVDAHRGYGTLLSLMGRFPEAFSIIRTLKSIDPISPVQNVTAGRIFYQGRHYKNAEKELKEALELEPRDFIASILLSLVLVQQRQYKKAMLFCDRALKIQNHVEFISMRGYIHARAGDEEKARRILSELNQKSKTTHVPTIFFSYIYSGLRELDLTFENLELAFKDRVPSLCALKTDPRWEPIRNDPRFDDLLRRIGLPVD